MADPRSLSLRKKDIISLKDLSRRTRRRRFRLCIHQGIEERLHEMFIVHPKGAYVRPHRHLNKLESIYIIEGRADLVLFKKNGKVKKVFKVSALPGEGYFYCRISGDDFHSLIIKSPVFVFYEVTTGPFRKLDTVFPDLAPLESDQEAVKKYLRRLKACIK